MGTDAPMPIPDPAELVRTPRNDGLNCLYLILRLFEKPPRYEDLRAALAPGPDGNNLAEIRTAARSAGLKTRVVKSTPDALRRGPFPMIAALDDPAENSGRFVLLVGLAEDKCILIDGGYALLKQVTIDDFRRNWSGYVLVAEPGSRATAYVSVGVGVVALAAYGAWLRRVRGMLLGAVFASAPPAAAEDTPEIP
jgi:ABC-type bacteriocin/lantibiotic exporter with double-glycine peptidase domain